MKRFQKAFTLIELLIVIAIIAILTVAFLPGALKAPARARDAGKIKKVQDVVATLEAYNAQKMSYPTDTQKNGCLSSDVTKVLNTDLPADTVGLSKCTGAANFYYYTDGVTFYTVGVQLETVASANAKIGALSDITAANTVTLAKGLINPTATDNNAYLVVGP